MKALAKSLDLPQSNQSNQSDGLPRGEAERSGEFGLPRGVSAEEIFGYIYAILHSPEYRRRYRDFLRIDFPRIPLPKSWKQFRQLATLGRELVSLHLMNHPKLQSAGDGTIQTARL